MNINIISLDCILNEYRYNIMNYSKISTCEILLYE